MKGDRKKRETQLYCFKIERGKTKNGNERASK